MTVTGSGADGEMRALISLNVACLSQDLGRIRVNLGGFHQRMKSRCGCRMLRCGADWDYRYNLGFFHGLVIADEGANG